MNPKQKQKRKEKITTKKVSNKAAPSAVPPPQGEGLPAPESIIREVEFISPKGTRYQIIETTEVDAYDVLVPRRGKKKRSKRK